jgi:hypothetical protein
LVCDDKKLFVSFADNDTDDASEPTKSDVDVFKNNLLFESIT